MNKSSESRETANCFTQMKDLSKERKLAFLILLIALTIAAVVATNALTKKAIDSTLNPTVISTTIGDLTDLATNGTSANADIISDATPTQVTKLD